MAGNIRIFDKSLYASAPSEHIGQAIGKLASLGPAIVAVRGPFFSANLLGTIYVGLDGGDPVLRVAESDCHVHIMWNKIHGVVLGQEDVGYGPEPVVWLTDEDNDPVINLFYPGKTQDEIAALLA